MYAHKLNTCAAPIDQLYQPSALGSILTVTVAARNEARQAIGLTAKIDHRVQGDGDPNRFTHFKS